MKKLILLFLFCVSSFAFSQEMKRENINGKIIVEGIDIEGKIGQNVSAASAGQVVYVGNSLKWYGNLVIIKHSEQFLSAYAHNQKLYVQEGQTVNASQRIASLGKDNMQRDALHFHECSYTNHTKRKWR